MKRYILFAGVNGAGKTTLYQTYPDIQSMPRINVDEIVRKIGNWKNHDDVMQAGITAVRLIKEYFEKGLSFNQETTLCGKSIFRNIRMAREQSYEIVLYYVGLDSAETAKKRVSQRVMDGGHGIPDSDIERRFEESLRNLKTVINLCDRVELYDNTYKFQQIAVIKKGKCVDVVEDIPLWCKDILSGCNPVIEQVDEA